MLAFHYISAKSWWASFIKGGKQRKPWATWIYMRYMNIHEVHEYTWIYMSYTNIHEVHEYTWGTRIYMRYMNIHEVHEYTWATWIYMKYTNIQFLQIHFIWFYSLCTEDVIICLSCQSSGNSSHGPLDKVKLINER
jgi:hypothetical protein